MNIIPLFGHQFVILLCDNHYNKGKKLAGIGLALLNRCSRSEGTCSMRILVVEDNHRLSSSLQMNLSHEGYSVDTAYDGQEGQDLAELAPYDLILLDILLPKKDGLEVCRELRRRRIQTPILLLTARDSIDDRVQGLDCGADDYLVKPFAMRELLARLRALLPQPSLHQWAVRDR